LICVLQVISFSLWYNNYITILRKFQILSSSRTFLAAARKFIAAAFNVNQP
jgi:hypothetical protein